MAAVHAGGGADARVDEPAGPDHREERVAERRGAVGVEFGDERGGRLLRREAPLLHVFPNGVAKFRRQGPPPGGGRP